MDLENMKITNKEMKTQIVDEFDLISNARLNVEKAFKILEGVSTFGKNTQYEDRQDKSWTLEKLNDVSNTLDKILMGTNI